MDLATVQPLSVTVPPHPSWGVERTTQVVTLGPFEPACRGSADDFSTAIHDLKHGENVDISPFGEALRSIVSREYQVPDRVVVVPGHDGGRPTHLQKLAGALPGPEVQTLERDPLVDPTKRIERDRDRWANVAGTTDVTSDVTGESILIVDDVLASGASLATAASALRTAGAAKVVGAVLGVRVPASIPTTRIASPPRRTN